MNKRQRKKKASQKLRKERSVYEAIRLLYEHDHFTYVVKMMQGSRFMDLLK